MTGLSPRPEASPHLGSPRADSDSRPRSRSQRLFDNLSEHLSRKPSHSPEHIGKGLVQAGLTLGSTGSEHLIHRTAQEIRDGTTAFVLELNRVFLDVRTESKRPGVERVNTGFVQGTIQLQTDGESEEELHAITDASDNPFDPASDTMTPLSPTNSEVNDYFIEDIVVPHHDHEQHGHENAKLWMRARLDSGMEDNAIREELALETGFEIEQYTGPDIIVGDGNTFRPTGYIELQFNFQRVQAARSWKVRFLIFPDPPFDVAFGRNFIYKAKLFQRPNEALPMEYKRMTPQQEREHWERTRERDRQSSSRQAEQDSRYASRRSRPAGGSSSNPSSGYRPSRGY